MSSKIDKDMLKNPDIFVSTSDKIFEYVEKHFKTVATLFGLVVVAGVGYVAYGYIVAAKEQKAAEALYLPEAALKKSEATVRDERAKQMEQLAVTGDKATETAKVKAKESAKDKAKKVAPASGESLRPVDYAKDFSANVTAVKSAIVANAMSKAAMVSALNLSYFLTQQKQYGEALAVLDLPKYHPSTAELLGGFWLMHRGMILLENSQVEPAMDSYESILKAPTLKPFHPEALLKLGLCYEVKGNPEKARETYEKLGREFPDTEASTTAQQYLRLLELNAHKQG